MPVTITLKGRLHDPLGRLTWHDGFVLLNAIGAIAKDKHLTKLAPWIGSSGKIQEAIEASEVGRKVQFGVDEDTGEKIWGTNLPDIQITLKNQQAHLLWKELESLPWKDFGVSPQTSGAIDIMLRDLASQLGEKIPEAEDKPEDES